MQSAWELSSQTFPSSSGTSTTLKSLLFLRKILLLRTIGRGQQLQAWALYTK